MSALDKLIAELRKSGLPPEAQACLQAIAYPNEMGPSGFRSLFGDAPKSPKPWTGSMASFPDWAGVQTSQGITHAAGAWQDQPGTYRDFAHITTSFEPQAQIQVNWALAQRDFKARTKGMDLLETLQAGRSLLVEPALLRTWPGGASGFASRYKKNLDAIQEPPAPRKIIVQIAATDESGAPVIIEMKPIGTPLGAAAGALSVGTKAAIGAVAMVAALTCCARQESDPRRQVAVEHVATFWEEHPPTFSLVPGPLGGITAPKLGAYFRPHVRPFGLR